MTESLQKLHKLEEAIYSRASDRLFPFFKKIWPVLEPSKPLLRNWHQELVAEYLEACFNRDITRLIINIPPRYTKSNLVTVTFPVWAWIKDPQLRFIIASYAQGLATRHSIDRRTIIESDWFQTGFKDLFRLSSDQNVKTEFENDKRGVMTATSILGTATGKGGDFIIIDDPHNVKQSESDQQRKTIINQFDRTFSTRLNDKRNGVIIIVMQRLHQNDLTGHLLSQGGWDHLCIPAICEKKTTYTFPISKKIKTREEGDILHEERENLSEINRQKKALGSYGFAGQYQQQPSPPGGSIFKRAWFQFYETPPEKFDEQIISFDFTFKDSKASDYVVGQCWGRKGSNKYLLDQVRDKIDFVTCLTVFQSFASKWPNAYVKLVEEKANGAAIINSLKDKIFGVIPISPKESKESRARAVSPQFEAGNIYLPDPSKAHWVHDYIEELCQFPKSSNDDQVDATTQALIRLEHHGEGNFVEEMIPDDNNLEETSGGDAW